MTETLLANAKVPVNELPGLLIPALLDTLTMVGIVMTIVVLVGVPLGALIHNLAPGGLFENPRCIPFSAGSSASAARCRS